MNKKILVRIICIVASFIIVIPLSAYFLLKDEDIPEVSPQGEIIKDEPSDTLQIALTNSDENREEKSDDNYITVDYFFYTENPDEKNFNVPETTKRNGKNYEYAGKTEYSISETMESIAITIELEVEDKNDAKDTIVYVSPETGVQYVLSADSFNWGELTEIKKRVTEKVEYTACPEAPEIPEIKSIGYINKDTAKEEKTDGKLFKKSYSEEYWAKAEEPIFGTFERDATDYTDYKTGIMDGDEEWSVKVDIDNTFPSWEGYEKDVLKIAGIPEEEIDNYRVIGADWVGEKYYDVTEFNGKETVVEKRDAAYAYEAKCRDYYAEYEGYGASLGYKTTVTYFTDIDEALETLRKKDKNASKDLIKDDIKTVYKMKVTATYKEVSAHKDTVKRNLGNDRSRAKAEKADKELLEKYKAYNEDCAGIISIEDTVLNHPLMQSPYDEDFYLTHDLDKNKNNYGVPFLTLSSDLKRENGNNIIYGHNILYNERDIFADLVFYENIEFYKNHPIIKLVTEDGTDYYLIFAYYLIDTKDNDFVYWDKCEWESESEYLKYMEEVDKRNWINCEIPCNINDKYLTLSSCSVELAHSGTNRMVVMARKLNPGEGYEKYIDFASPKESPLLPSRLK
ncbi:sortase, SrtB family [Lachnospiraceae bacterium G41]|nr:sortase, SrtB family [Lachnospiraceae bacterium G41]